MDALRAAEPALAERKGERLGDMLPFPALVVPGEIDLVLCRFPDQRPIRIRGEGSGWRPEWGRVAVRALDASLPAVDLALVPAAPPGERLPAEIRVEVRPTVNEGPSGLGDTLTECDVRALPGERRSVRGELVRAHIRMRRTRRDLQGVDRMVSADEWVGAFMHELGHALGYSGHASFGETVLVRDQDHLRRLGRQALDGLVPRDLTLGALYALPAGRRVGRRSLRPVSHRMLEQVRAIVASRERSGVALTGVLAGVGDEAARLVWRFERGDALVARFPWWRRELRAGGALTLIPDLATLRAIQAHRAQADPSAGRRGSGRGRSGVDVGLEGSGLRDHLLALAGLTEGSQHDAQSE